MSETVRGGGEKVEENLDVVFEEPEMRPLNTTSPQGCGNGHVHTVETSAEDELPKVI